jgi:sodium-dependent dicarboxylate transporter 2/3/5
VLPEEGASPTVLLILMASLSMLLSAGISNAAAVAVLLPVGYALCDVTSPGVHPMAMTYAVAISSGLAFALPISSPPNAICYASGYYGMRDVLKHGVVITALAVVAMIALIMVYWPAIGAPLTR